MSDRPAAPQWSRRELTRALLASLLLPQGCGGTSKPTLSLYNWGDYIARSVLDAFVAREVAAGRALEIVEDVFLSEAEMVAKLKTLAAYDVVFPIDYLLDELVRNGSLRRIDPASLANVKHLGKHFAPWHNDEGTVYAIPYLWGTTGIGYDSEKVDKPTSWKALFDPRYAGHISVIDSKGDVMDQALLAAGLDINSRDKAKIREVVAPMLQQQKQILRAYDSNPARALTSGDTWIAQIDSGDLLAAQASKPSLQYVIPDEGAALWTDYVAIASASKSPELALRFIDYLLEPEVAASNANTLSFATPNGTALEQDLIDAADDPHIYPPPEVIAHLQRSQNWVGGNAALVDELWQQLRG